MITLVIWKKLTPSASLKSTDWGFGDEQVRPARAGRFTSGTLLQQ